MALFWQLVRPDGFLPHGHCYLWRPGLIGLHVASDMVIGLSYVAISVTLAYLVRRTRGEIPFGWMLLAFGLFIIACGGTHFMEVWTLWTPAYWLSGDLKLVTAAASAATALALPPLVPRALELIGAAKLADERKRELETLYARLQELDALKTAFFANVSHELRTPLALILGPSERFQKAENLTEEQRQDLTVIRRNAHTLLKHVNDLLDVARLEAGRVMPHWSAVDLARLLRLVASRFEGLADSRRIRLTIDAPDRVPIDGDPDQLGRVVMNILSNAFKFVPDEGRVHCGVEVAGERVRVRVEDSGPGLPPELRDVVFERYRQGEGGPDRRFGGSGLGLAIAREFVELHDGSISVGDGPLGGAAFVVELPRRARPGVVVAPERELELADVALGDATAPAAPDGPADVTEPAGGGRGLVLVVEDNAEMRRFVAAVLGAEYRVATARDGREGLDRARALEPDVIVADVMMPQLAGEAFVEEVRRCPELERVPIVVLTAATDDDLRTRLLRQGAQDYLTKPFSGDELRARVANQLSMKSARDVLQTILATRALDLKTLAAELGARTRELERSAAAIRAARDQAEQASRVKTQFLNLVSHELRTPLTAIQNFLYVLQKDAEALLPKQRELLARVGSAARRLLALVESLLEYARIESGRLTTKIEPFDLSAIARDLIEEFQPLAEQERLGLALTIAPDLPPLVSDARLVRLVLGNLTGNALKYTERGTVTIALRYEGRAHRVSVTDTGSGIPAEFHERIFEPFVQLETIQHKHTPGMGLGLALVRQMVEALGGRVDLHSEVGVGSTFTVVFPTADANSGHAEA